MASSTKQRKTSPSIRSIGLFVTVRYGRQAELKRMAVVRMIKYLKQGETYERADQLTQRDGYQYMGDKEALLSYFNKQSANH